MAFNSFIENKFILIILVPKHFLYLKKSFVQNNFKNGANIKHFKYFLLEKTLNI